MSLILYQVCKRDCSCSYCREGKVGLVLPECRCRNAWRSIRWYWRGCLHVIRWVLPRWWTRRCKLCRKRLTEQKLQFKCETVYGCLPPGTRAKTVPIVYKRPGNGAILAAAGVGVKVRTVRSNGPVCECPLDMPCTCK